ncbi:MAG: 1,6-anhydro-N-acetylmuramyl-L-alanine amidase AmpD [Deltaproteobacteria bacterium]|nr:1,6-anhydro-N-acetylmuramyl-L-alanine amidase AmpD [Deltaproteobacteria bacterium]
MIVPGLPFLPSPNFSSRDGAVVDAVVLHHISLPPGEFGGPYVVAFFQNRLDPEAHPYFRQIADLRVSAHFFLERSGAALQLVDTEHKAWHAGESRLGGVPDVNRFSVGIELEGDEETAYTDAQYGTLRSLLRALRTAHPGITPERIVGHEHVSPGRKRDPGPFFDWARVRRDLLA